MTEESAVKVCVRVRPLIEREEAANAEGVEPVQLYWRADRQTIHQLDDGNVTKSFNFDRVFSAKETTKQLYQDIAKSLVVSTVEGYNGTIFAYGQTSSGKTFTMMGNSRTPGVIPLAMEDVFQTIKNCPRKEFLLRVSYMEIYNETVTDLLCDSWKRKPLEIREGNYKNVYVADLTEELVTSPEQALAWIRKGEKNRHYGKTKMNERSSRSHTIFRMIIESRERSDPASGEISDGAIIVSHLNLVDLAGAERASQTGAEGTRFKEGCNINRSLFTLGQVIKKLSDENQKGFTNYRDSKLTRILQNSLGGNAKTVIVCTITPAVQDETLSTLQFASAAKRMKNDPHVTEVSDDGALLRRYRNEISELKQRLQEVSSVTQTTVTEKQTLCQLLQEKEQLQREQEDRIRNLTKLLVTASNVVPIKKVPKRRMTWGGKLLQAAVPTDADSETGFMEPFVKQRRIDLSAIVEQDDMEEFDGRWEIPLERTLDLDLNHSTVTTRNSSESDYCSPMGSDMNGRLANLEEQLEKESQLRQEMQQQLEMEAQEKQELHIQLEKEAQEKQDLHLQLEKEAREKHDLHLQLEQEAQEKQDLHLQLEKEAQEKQDLHLQLEKEAQEKQDLHLQLEKEAQEKQDLHLQLEKEAQEKQDLHLQLEKENQEKQDLHLQLEKETQEKQDLHLQLEKESQEKQDLHLQLEKATQEKQDLHLQLDKEAQVKQKLDLQLEEMPDKEELDLQHEIERMELQQQLEVEVLQKQEAMRRAVELEKKVFELEQQLEATPHNTSNYASEQFKRDLGESIQLCESLAFEKERLEAERDLLHKELQVSGEEIEQLKQDSKALQEELVQKEEMDEFQSLEEESKREYEQELLTEIATLKKEAEDSKIQFQQLKAELDSLSELQGDKDLVQEVQRLRRSLEDAECLSRDTKREWAFLRSENLSLKERDDVLSAEHQRMQTELHSAQTQLEAEKSRFKKMQMDLQKELMGAFDENTKLTTLLDGKVPKNLVDGVILERTVAELKKELEQHKQNGEELQSQLELYRQRETELQNELEQKVNSLSQQVCELTGHLCEVQTEREELLSAQQSGQEQRQLELQSAHEQQEQLRVELQKAQGLLQEALQKAREHQEQEQRKAQEQQQQFEEKLQQNQQISSMELQKAQEQLESMQQELQRAQEQEVMFQQELHKAQEQLQQDKEQHQQELQSYQEQHQQKLQKAHEHQQEELQKTTEVLHQDLKNTQEEQEKLQLELQNALEKQETLQQELHNAQEHQRQQEVEFQRAQEQQEQLQQELQKAQEQLQDHLISQEPGACSEELEKLRSDLSALTAQRAELQEILEGVREEKNQLKRDLEESVDMCVQTQSELQQLQSKLSCSSSATNEQLQQLNREVDELRQEKQQLQADLQENVDMMIENQTELREALDKVKELEGQLATASHSSAQVSHSTENSLEAKAELDHLHAEVASLTAERDQLKSERGQKAQELEALQQQLGHESTQETQQQKLLQAQAQQQELEEKLQRAEELLQQELHRGQDEQERLQEKLQKAEEQQEVLQHQLCELQEQQQQKEEELQRRQEQKEQLEQELQHAQEMQEMLQQQLCNNQLPHQENQAPLQQELHQAQIEQQQQELLKAQEQHQQELLRAQQQQQSLEQELSTALEQQLNIEKDLQKAQEHLEQLQQELQESRHQHSQDVQKAQEQQQNFEEELRKNEELLHQELQRAQEEQELLQEELQKAQEQLQDHGPPQALEEACGELERLRSDLSSSTAQREELQEILEGLREEKNQLKRELEENVDMAQQHLQELEELRQEKTQVQSELQSSMSKASELEVQLRCVTEERQHLLGDNEAAQTLQKQVDQLRCEILSLTADREQLQERLREGENRHSEELKELTAQREQLLQQQTAVAAESSEELERLRSDFSALTAQRAELQEFLEGVREEKNQLKRDLEENVGMAQQQLNELEEITLEKSRLQSDLHNNMERASELEAQLRCVTEERQRLLGDNEAAQTLQQQVDQLQSEVSSLTADREQLQERLKEGENRHSEELSAQREQLLQQQTAAAAESSKELEKLRSDLSTLAAQRAELQELLEGVREEKTQLKKDLEENVGMVQRMKGEMMTQETSYTDLTELVAQENESQQKLKEWSLRMQCLAEHVSQKLEERWTSQLLASAELTQRRQINKLLPHLPHLQPLSTSLRKSTLQVQDLLWTRLVLLEKLSVAYRSHYEALWQQEASAVEQSGLMAQAQKSTSRQPCPPQNVLLCLLLERRELHLQDMAVVVQRLEDGVAELEKALRVEVQHCMQANQRLGELSSHTPASPSAVSLHLQQETSRRLSVASCEKTICQVLRSEHLRVANSKLTHEQRCQMEVPVSLAQPATSELQQDNQQLRSKLQQALTHTQAVEKKLQHLQEAHELSSQQCSQHQLQLKELQDKLGHAQTMAQSRMPPSAAEMQKMKEQLVSMELQNTNLNTSHQQQLERLTSMLKHKEELIRKLKEDLRMKQQDDEHSYMDDYHTKQCGHQEEIQQLQQKIALLESQLSSQQEEVDRWKRRAYKLKESRREGGLHTPTKHACPPTPTKHTVLLTPTKHTLSHTQSKPSPSKRPALGEAPLLNSPQRPLLDSPKSLFFDMPPGTHGPPIARTKGFFDNCALGTTTDSEGDDADPMAAEGPTGGGSTAKKDEWWPRSPKQGQQCETQ